MTDKEKIEEILYKFSSPYSKKHQMLHQDNFSGASSDLEALIQEREREAVDGFAKSLDKEAQRSEGKDGSITKFVYFGKYADKAKAYLKQKEEKE